MIPANVKALLDAVYGTRWGEAYIEWSLFNAKGGGFNRDPAVRDFGRAATAAPPDDKAVFWSAGLLKPGMSRANENVERMMVFVMDDVGFAPKSKISPLDLLGLPEPTIMIESSPGNWQWQWGITDGMMEDEAAALRASLPVKSDATAPSNLIRLPMGVSGKTGVIHKVTGSDLGPVYLWADFVAGCGGYKVAITSVHKSRAGLEAPSIGHVEAALKALPNDGVSVYCKDYKDGWIPFGMALYGATGGRGFDLWEKWNEPQGQKRDLREVWDSFYGTHIGWVKLRWIAREQGSGYTEAVGALAQGAFNDNPPPADESEAEILALQRDVANSIVMLYRDKIRWNVSSSMWHRFDGVWKESPYPLGYRLAKKWADAAAPTLGPAARAAVSKSAFYEGVEKILKTDPAIAVVKTDFDVDDWLLGTPGGTVDLRTGALVPPKASDMISFSTSVAPAATEDCPKWLAFVEWACSDPKEPDPLKRLDIGMLETLKQWAGYCLTGDVSEEMLMFFHGGGANGKGTFVETLQAVLGDYFHLAAKDLFMATKYGTHTEDVAVLAGKRMVVADEVPTSAQWNESFLKSVSGGGSMTSRHLYGRPFTFPIRFKVTIIGNEKPTFQGAINEALKRRLHLMEFLNKADPKSNTLKRELVAEAPGVLRWMINGLLDKLAEPEGKLFVADCVISATDDYFSESDLFGQWLVERTEPTPGKDGPAGALFEDWEGWRNEQGNHHLYNSHKKFKEEMVKRGKTWKEARLGSFYKDLSVKTF